MVRPPVVLIHGFGCDGSFWEPQLAALTAAGHCGAAPDLPCHGEAAGDLAPSLGQIAERIAGMCAAPTVFVGHSMGGMVALQVARTHPELVAGLALVDAFPSLQVNAAALPGLFVEHGDLELRRAIRERWTQSSGRMDPAAHDALWETVRTFDASGWLGDIACPLLGVYGGRGRFGVEEGDRLCRELLLDRVAGPTRVCVIPGAGHFVNLEQPEAVSRILIDWLEQLSPRDGGDG